jgi:hypothetical protein
MTDEMEHLRDRVDDIADKVAPVQGIKTTVERIEKHLLGNGQPGLVVRTDRLEQKDKFRSKLLWIFMSGVVLLLLNEVAGLIGLAN